MPHLQKQQLINLLLLLALGYSSANIFLSLDKIVLILLFTLVLEHGLLYIKEKKISYFSYSSLTTAIGVILMMASTQDWIYYCVIGLALLQKHFLHFHSRHIFNPSNVALILVLLLFYTQAHLVLGQLGDASWLLYLVLLMGVLILVQAKRWIISVVFVCSYLLLQYAIIVLSDPVIIFEDIYERFYAISFIVFILFMLTDPRTTPVKVRGQVLFALGIAFGATFLDYVYGFRVQHLFLSLFVLSAFYGLFAKEKLHSYKDKSIAVALFILVLSAIIYIQMQVPYYYEMDG